MGVVDSIATAAVPSSCLQPRTAVMGRPPPPPLAPSCAGADDGNVYRKLTGDHNDAISSYKCNYSCDGV